MLPYQWMGERFARVIPDPPRGAGRGCDKWIELPFVTVILKRHQFEILSVCTGPSPYRQTLLLPQFGGGKRDSLQQVTIAIAHHHLWVGQVSGWRRSVKICLHLPPEPPADWVPDRPESARGEGVPALRSLSTAAIGMTIRFPIRMTGTGSSPR
jgi:hypothetical protein